MRPSVRGTRRSGLRIVRGPGKGVRFPVALGLILLSFSLVSASANAQVEKHLSEFPVIDPLNRTESTLSNEGKWSALAWDTETSLHKTGKDTTAGWAPSDASPAVNGAFWNPDRSSWMKDEETIAITMATKPNSNRYLSLWMNMPNPSEVKSGYELRWLQDESGTFTMTLSKWTSGTQTVLKSASSVSIPAGSTIGLTDRGSLLSAEVETGGKIASSFTAFDSSNAYGSGFIGIEGSGSLSRSTNFRAGSPYLTTVEDEIAALPVTDLLNREETPLSNGGKWSPLGWATSSKPAGKDFWNGWTSSESYPAISGAYWNQKTLNAATGGDAVSVKMAIGPGLEGRYLALRLNMGTPWDAGKSSEKGLELKWTVNADKKTYTMELREGGGGILDSESEVVIPSLSTVALYDSGTIVYALLSSGNGKLVPILSGTPAPIPGIHSGYAGIEAMGNSSRVRDFRIGSPALPASIAALPMQDGLSVHDVPLSNGGKWKKLAWAANTGAVSEISSTMGWRPSKSTETSGAYWNPATFGGTNASDAASLAIVDSVPQFEGSYQAVWLNMPHPGEGGRSGYEARWTTLVGSSFKHELTISKWVNGEQTVLATKGIKGLDSGVIGVGNPITLTYQKGTLTLWESGPTYLPLLSATDSTYISGYAGIQTGGSFSAEAGYKFRAGTF